MPKLTDEEFQLQADYRTMNPMCEIWPVFKSVHGRKRYPRSFGGVWLSEYLRRPHAGEIHHICGSGNGAKRVNVVENIVHVSHEAHTWLESEKLAGLVMCLMVKRAKGELDWKVLDEIKGKSVRGWLESDAVRDACRISDGLMRFRWTLIEEG